MDICGLLSCSMDVKAFYLFFTFLKGSFEWPVNFVLQYNALIRSQGHRALLVELINQKEVVGGLFNQLRLALQRRTMERPAQVILPTQNMFTIR